MAKIRETFVERRRVLVRSDFLLQPAQLSDHKWKFATNKFTIARLKRFGINRYVTLAIS